MPVFSLTLGAERSRRLRQALIASVLVVGQLLGVLHFALVQHVVCLEHGELAHAASTSASTGWVAPRAVSPIEAGIAQETAFVQSSDDHQHCLIQAKRQDSVSRECLSTPLIADGFDNDNHWADVAPLERSVLLRLAPKHSPPA